MKICSYCNEEKPLIEFGIRSRKDGITKYKTQCKPCLRKWSKEHRITNSEKIAEQRKIWHKNFKENNPEAFYMQQRRSTWKMQGIDPDLAEAYYRSHNGVCEICQIQYSVLCVDHCHKSGKIRGVLCHHCNQALGLFKDDTTRLQNAINYLNNSIGGQ